MSTNRHSRAATATAAQRTRSYGLLGLAVVMVGGMLLSGCNTTAGVGQDVSATGQAVTRGAQDVKKGL